MLRILQAGDPQASPGAGRKIVWAIQREYVALDYKIFSGYAWLYNRLFFFVRRAQEYEADRIAAQVVGGAELASALRRVYALSAAWSDFQNRFLRPMRGVGCVPDDPFDVFGRMLTDPGYQAVLREWAASPPEQPAAPLDSHPCLADRLIRLSNLRDRGGAPRGGAGPRSASDLLPVLPDRPWIPQLIEATAGTTTLDSLPWDECVNRLGQARAAALAGRLLRAAAAVSPAGAGGEASPVAATPTLSHVLDLVQTRRGDLAAAVAGAPGRADREDPLTPLTTGLLALLGCVMVATGRVRWQVSWRERGDPMRLTAQDTANTGIEQIRDRVNSFVTDPGSANADSISLLLRSLGVDPDIPVRLTFAGAVSPTVPRPDAGGLAAPGTTVVIHPALDPRRDLLQPVVRGIGVVALLVVTVVGAVSGSHASSPQFPPLAEPTPSYAQPTYRLPSVTLPSPLPLPRLTLPFPPPSAILVPIPGQTMACLVFAAGASCTVITVAPGDTLSLLACRYRTSVRVLEELNDLGTSTTIDAGQRLVVPNPKDGPAACG